jgi:hypothetical protein
VLALSPAARIYLAAGATDLHKGFDDLAAIARRALLREHMSGAFFVLANSHSTRIRFLT